MGRRFQDVEEVFTSLVKQTNKMGFEIHDKKDNEYLQLSTYNCVTVKNYTYLGTIPTNENELKLETVKTITNASRESYALLPLLKNQSVFRVGGGTISH